MNPETHNIYIVGKDGSELPKILETYKGGVFHTTAGIDGIAAALISQAESKISKLGNGYYLTTNSPYIAQKYNLKLLK